MPASVVRALLSPKPAFCGICIVCGCLCWLPPTRLPAWLQVEDKVLDKDFVLPIGKAKVLS
jgi:hypothetical protein